MNSLPLPAFYFPLRNPKYDVSPNLFRLNTAFGNGQTDSRLLQFDSLFPQYRTNKKACYAERRTKYVCEEALDPDTAEAVTRLLVIRAVFEYPTLFSLEMAENGAGVLSCFLTGDRLALDARARLAEPCGDFRNALEAVCCQLQEDIAIVRRTPARGEWIAYLHLCSPSFWGAEEKIGKSFAEAHRPVPGFAKVTAVAETLTQTIIHRGPYVRFTWGIALDNRLNQHPDPPAGLPTAQELRQQFDPAHSPLYFRVERQVLWGFPDLEAFLFTIRVYLYPIEQICATVAHRDTLYQAIATMSPEAVQYKGLAGIHAAVLSRLAKTTE
jgi:hypothetical protein